MNEQVGMTIEEFTARGLYEYRGTCFLDSITKHLYMILEVNVSVGQPQLHNYYILYNFHTGQYRKLQPNDTIVYSELISKQRAQMTLEVKHLTASAETHTLSYGSIQNGNAAWLYQGIEGVSITNKMPAIITRSITAAEPPIMIVLDHVYPWAVECQSKHLFKKLKQLDLQLWGK